MHRTALLNLNIKSKMIIVKKKFLSHSNKPFQSKNEVTFLLLKEEINLAEIKFACLSTFPQKAEKTPDLSYTISDMFYFINISEWDQ